MGFHLFGLEFVTSGPSGFPIRGPGSGSRQGPPGSTGNEIRMCPGYLHSLDWIGQRNPELCVYHKKQTKNGSFQKTIKSRNSGSECTALRHKSPRFRGFMPCSWFPCTNWGIRRTDAKMCVLLFKHVCPRKTLASARPKPDWRPEKAWLPPGFPFELLGKGANRYIF